MLRTEPWVVSQYHCLLKMDTLVISMGVEGLAHTVIAEIAFVIVGCSIIIIAQFFTPTGFVLVGLKNNNNSMRDVIRKRSITVREPRSFDMRKKSSVDDFIAPSRISSSG